MNDNRQRHEIVTVTQLLSMLLNLNMLRRTTVLKQRKTPLFGSIALRSITGRHCDHDRSYSCTSNDNHYSEREHIVLVSKGFKALECDRTPKSFLTSFFGAFTKDAIIAPYDSETSDPTPFLYDTTCYAAAGLMGISTLANLFIQPLNFRERDLFTEK